MNVKILHWNIWYKEKIENVLQLIKNTKADILCLQEVTIGRKYNNYIDTPKYLADKLQYHHFFKECQTRVKDGKVSSFGNGIFSKYRLKNKAFHYIQKPAKEDLRDYSKHLLLRSFAGTC